MGATGASDAAEALRFCVFWDSNAIWWMLSCRCESGQVGIAAKRGETPTGLISFRNFSFAVLSAQATVTGSQLWIPVVLTHGRQSSPHSIGSPGACASVRIEDQGVWATVDRQGASTEGPMPWLMDGL